MRSEKRSGGNSNGNILRPAAAPIASQANPARRRREFRLHGASAAAAAAFFIAGSSLVNAGVVTFNGPSNPAGSTSFNTSLDWSDGNAPNASSDYQVFGGFAIRTPASGGSITFLGNSLTLGNSTTTGQLTDKNTGAFNVTTINNFTLNDGIIQNGGDAAGTAWTDDIAGNGITVGVGGATFDSGAAGRSFRILDSIGGAGNVIIASAGSIQFNASDSYGGTTTVNSGATLLLNAANSVGGNGNITLSGNLVANGTNAVSGTGNISITGGTLLLDSTTALSGGGLITFGTGTGTLEFGLYDTTDYASEIKNSTTAVNINTNGQFVNFTGNLDSSNSAGLTKNGAGTLMLSGSNSYGGTTTLTAGTLSLNSSGALGSGSGLISFGGGTLQYTANNTTDYSSRFAIATTTAGNTYRIDTNGQTISFASPLVADTAAGSLTKLGLGTLNLSATNTYTGTTAVVQGTLNLQANAGGNVINAASALSLQGGTFQVTGDNVGGADSQTLASTTAANGDSTLSLVQGGAASVMLNLGTLAHVSGGTINFAQGSNPGVLQFNTATGSASSLINDAGVAYATVGGTDWAAKDSTNTYVVGGSTIAGFYTLDTATTISGNADVGATNTTLAAPAASTSLRFNDGTGAWTLNLGGFALSTGGILVTPNVGNNLATISSGTLSSDSTTTNKDLEIIQNNTANSLAISAVISNNGSVVTGLTKSGPGNLILSGANTYTGPTIVSAGTLSLPTGGSITTSTGNIITVGNAAGHNAVLSISGGTVTAADTAVGQFGNSLLVGSVLGAAGDIQMGSGTLTTAEQLTLGNGVGAYAGLTQSGGSITSGTYFVVGFGTDQAVFNQTGGTFTITSDVMTIAANAAAVAVANLSGGTFTANGGGNDAGTIYVGENGTGTLNVSGTASVTLGTANANGLYLGRGQNSGIAASGTVNLLGGTISTGLVSRGVGSAFFNFDGGTLRALASTTNFMNGLSAARVYGGATGSTIDNNGFNITIGQALLAATGNGVHSIAVSGGAGYIDSPLVEITGGGGSGAAATATVNPATGAVTAINITNPGVGYTSAPIVTLSGGGGSGALIGAITTTPNNTAGIGLNLKGAGITTLSGASTYTGSTNLANGTLLVTGSLASTGQLNIASGATLQGAGSVGLTTLSSSSILNVGNSNSTVGTLTTASLSSAGGATPSTLNFWLTNATSYDQITVGNAGGLTINGGSLNLFISGGNSAFTTPGAYNLFNINGGFSGSLSNFSIGNAQPGESYTLSSSSNAITLTIATVSSFSWTGASSANTQLYTDSNNWFGNAAPPSAAGTAVTFGTANTTGNGTVNLNSPQTLGTIIFDSGGGSLSYNIIPTVPSNVLTFSSTSGLAGIAVNNGSHAISAAMSLASPTTVSGAAGTTLTLGGNISGANGLTVSSSGSVILTGTNSYTTTVVTGASLQVGNGGAGGSLGTGATSLASGSNLIFDLSGPLALAGPITGVGGTVTQNGTSASSVKLASSGNTFTGLAVNSGTFDLNGNSLTLTAFSGSGGGSQSVGTGIITDSSAAGGTTILTYNGTASTDYYGQINDGTGANAEKIALAIGLASGDTLTLHSASTFSGGTSLNTGILAVTNTDANGGGLGTGPIAINTTNTGIPTQLQLGNGTTINNNITINAAAAGVGNGVLTVPAAATASTTSTFGGTVTINALTTNGGDIVGPQAGGNLIFNGPIVFPSNSTATVLVIRAGDVQLAGGGSYPAVGITGPGTTSLGANNGIATNAVVELGLNNAAGTLDLFGFSQTVAGITEATASAANIVDSNPQSDGNGNPLNTLTVNTSATAFPDTAPDTYAGLINAPGGLNLAKTGAGTLLMTGTANTFVGVVTINAGVLGAAALNTGGTADSLGFGNAGLNNIPSLVFGGGTLRYTGATPTTTDRNFSINDNTVGVVDVSTSGVALTFTGNASFDGTEAANPASFAKGPGPGTLIVTGNLPYHGNTSVQGGVLLVNNPGVVGTAGSGTVSVAAGAILGGTGTISGTFDHTTGTIEPGATVGATSGNLTFTDPLKLDGGTALFNVNSSSLSSGINIGTQGLITDSKSGGLSFGGTSEIINLQFANGTLPASFTLNLFDYSGTLGGTSNLTYTSNLGRATFTTDTATTGELNVDVITSGAATLNWNSTTSAAWDTSSPNWYNTGSNASDMFHSGDNVNLVDNNAHSTPANGQLVTSITLGSVVTPGSLTDSANTNNYTLSGAGGIGGASTTLTMTGASTLTLETANTYGGSTTINNGGTINLGGSTTSGTLGSSVVTNNGNLRITRTDTTLTLANTIGNTVTGQGALTYSGGGTLTLSGPITQGTITVTGASSGLNLTGGRFRRHRRDRGSHHFRRHRQCEHLRRTRG